jgi:hypothetical protein
MARQVVFTSKAAKPSPTYSQAVKAAGLVFVSGTAPTDPETGQIKGTTIQEQTKQCLTNIAGHERGVDAMVSHESPRTSGRQASSAHSRPQSFNCCHR